MQIGGVDTRSGKRGEACAEWEEPDSTRSQLATSSTANGKPSRRAHNSPTAAAFSSVTANSGTTAFARSTN